jgi:hypothetical protein
MANTLRFKRGLASGIPTGVAGEPLFTTDTFDLYIGNGATNTRFQKYIASGTTSQYLRGDGTLATFPSLTGFVPYTGATANVDLGVYTILAQNATIASSGSGDTATINHSSGSGIALNITKGGNGEGLYINKTSGSGNAATIIGTLNATTLVKSGGTSTQYLMADGSVSTLTNPITGTGTTNYLPKFTGASTLGDSTIRTDAAGNIGINVTPSAWSGVGRSLELASSSFITTQGQYFYTGSNFYFNGTNEIRKSNGFATSYSQQVGQHEWSTAPNGTAADVLTFTQRARITATGNFIINNSTSDSGEKLQVTGTAKITGATNIGGNLTVDTNVLFVDTTNNRVGIGTAFPDHPLTIQTAGTGLGVRIIGYQGDNFLHLNNTLSTGNRTYQILAGITGIGYNGLSIYDSVAAQTRFVIDNSGNVGLGLNAPTERLHVSGNGIITGNLTVDTNTLFVDATNNRVGIGTVSPTYTLTTVVPSSTNADIFLAGMTGVSNGFTVQRVSSNFVYTFLDGNVGIGITPTEKLHVSGNATITGNLTVDSSTFFVDATANEVGIGTSSPNSSLQVVGSVSKSISDVKTANYTATATDHTILCSAAGGGFTITLPAASGITGRIYVIKKTNASSGVNSVTVDGNGAETIDGSASINLACRSSVTLQCDGSNWHILSLYSDTSCL